MALRTVRATGPSWHADDSTNTGACGRGGRQAQNRWVAPRGSGPCVGAGRRSAAIGLQQASRHARTLSSWMSLSMPRGPSVVRTVSASAMHALMLLTSCGVPWLVSVPSFSRMIWGCCGAVERAGQGAVWTRRGGVCIAQPGRARHRCGRRPRASVHQPNDLMSSCTHHTHHGHHRGRLCAKHRPLAVCLATPVDARS